MAKKRAKMTLSKTPKARTGDFEQLFATNESSEQAAGLKLVAVRVDKIEADPIQPRRLFDDDTISDLSASLQQDGLIQPIEVVQVDRDRYRIVHGERRWRAAQHAGWETIPAIVKGTEYDEITLFVRQMVENIHREDLNDIDRAAGLAHLRDLLQAELNAAASERGEKPWSSKATWAKVGERMGYSRQRVSQLNKLLELPPEIQDSVQSGGLSERDTRVFHNLTKRQQRALHRARVIDGTISQAETKRVADYLKKGRATSVSESIKAVQSGEDKVVQPVDTHSAADIGRRLAAVTRTLEQLDVSGVDSAESPQLITQLNKIQKQINALTKQLK